MDASGMDLALFIQENIKAYYTNMTNDQRQYGVPLMQSLGKHMKQHFANGDGDGPSDNVSFFFFPNIFLYEKEN